MMKNIIIIFIISILILPIYACKAQNTTITFNDITVDIPKDFKKGFLDNSVAVDNSVEFSESYGVERKTAIYTVVYIKYKLAYSGRVSLENARNTVIDGLRNNKAIQEFQIVNEGPVEGYENSYQILLSFYYGPNKTYHKSFLMLHDNALLQIMCMYNANSKKDDKEINNIINSVRILENNTNN